MTVIGLGLERMIQSTNPRITTKREIITFELLGIYKYNDFKNIKYGKDNEVSNVDQL